MPASRIRFSIALVAVVGCGGSDEARERRDTAAVQGGVGGVPQESAGTGGDDPGSFDNSSGLEAPPPAQAGTAPNSGGPPGCTSAMIEPVVRHTPGRLLVIYDRSLSMQFDFQPGLTRFDATDTAVKSGLQPFVCPPGAPDGEGCSEGLTVGAILFPSVEPLLFPDCTQLVDPIDTAMQIQWQPVSQFLESWSVYWSDPLTTGRLILGTPIEDAFRQGAAAIEAAPLDGNTAVLFLTDGESTCIPGDPGYPAIDTAGQAEAWAAAGILTYVVSVAPPTGVFNDQVARAGGTDQSINPTDTDQLTEAIRTIAQETVVVADCRTELSGQRLSDLDGACERGTVVLGTEQIECDPSNGFQIPNESELELVGAACEGLQSGLTLTATFPCDVLVE